jgi:hypothetical protein
VHKRLLGWAVGEKADRSKVSAMPAGIFIALAPNTPQFGPVDGETVIQLNHIVPREIAHIDLKGGHTP